MDGAGEQLEFEVGDEPSPAMFRAIAETAVNPFALIDDDGVFRWVGQSIEELLGWRPDEIVGRGIDAIVDRGSLEAVAQAFADLEGLPPRSNYPRGGVGKPADLICRDGTTTPCNLLAATRSQPGLPYHLVFARRAGYEQALDVALEAIAGHAELDDVLEPLVTTLQQSIPRCVVAIGDGWEHDHFGVVAGDGVDLLLPGADSPWARALATGEDVLVSDLNRFKPVNDKLGHLAGDRVLQAVAHRLDAALRPGDLVARIGGDEFAVLCERLVDPGDVVTVAERLIDAVAEPVVLDDTEVSITTSIGVAELGRGATPDEILARADLAMREAKSRGPGRWVSHPPL